MVDAYEFRRSLEYITSRSLDIIKLFNDIDQKKIQLELATISVNITSQFCKNAAEAAINEYDINREFTIRTVDGGTILKIDIVYGLAEDERIDYIGAIRCLQEGGLVLDDNSNKMLDLFESSNLTLGEPDLVDTVEFAICNQKNIPLGDINIIKECLIKYQGFMEDTFEYNKVCQEVTGVIPKLFARKNLSKYAIEPSVFDESLKEGNGLIIYYHNIENGKYAHIVNYGVTDENPMKIFERIKEKDRALDVVNLLKNYVR